MRVVDVGLTADRRELELIYDDGCRRTLSASLLWTECPSAQGRVRRMNGAHQKPPAGLLISTVNDVGSYGVNIAFSDGHARGIYPWAYLAALAEKPQLEDFLID